MPEAVRRVIFTVGHSTRSLDELISLLKTRGVTALADIRTIPRSRRYPHFAQEALSRALPAAGITYRHFPGLGGLRKPRPDSTNTAWRHPGFRGFADYMQTPAFARALEELIEAAASGGEARRIVIMCAEALWWRCHRQLVSDALVAAGLEVRHITSMDAAPPHELTSFARAIDGKVTYEGLL